MSVVDLGGVTTKVLVQHSPKLVGGGLRDCWYSINTK